jgi:3-deoxy-7-phosphoheptulonate synthase
MAETLPVRLGPVTLGHSRISVVALVGPAAGSWSPADWEQVRESGVSVVCATGPVPRSDVPSVARSDIAVGTDPEAPGLFFLDTACQISHYPGWTRSLDRPWGPLLDGPDVVPLALAAVSAGASLVAVKCPEPGTAGALVAELKGLAGLLGRELTRVPKRAEGTVARTGGDAKLRYGGRRGQRVAFQGEHGAFSEMAVFNLFSSETSQAVALPTFREVFAAVLAGDVDFGMVPIENALAGPINENYDLLVEFSDLHIVGETQVRVEHNLIGIPGTSLDTIKRVFSHPQGLAQSKVFLDSHPAWEAVPFYDTAGSVKHVARSGDPTLAAIASAEAARVYSMEILVPGVETNQRNFTRFFLIARHNEEGEGVANKASLVFTTADAPGALSRCLAVFASHGVNMTKLESRPIHGRPWDYKFYVDARLPDHEGAFEAAVAELGQVAKELRVLGIYEA